MTALISSCAQWLLNPNLRESLQEAIEHQIRRVAQIVPILKLTPAIALKQKNIEQRRAACEMLGWANILRDLDAKTLDKDRDPQIGELVEVDLPDLQRKARFLRVQCGTGREFAIGIPPHIDKALDAQAWIVGLEPKDFSLPEVRT